MGEERLRSARLAAGLSQSDLAAVAGLSRQAVGAIEAGRHRPGVDAALAISHALGIPVEALFGPRTTGCDPVLGIPAAEGEAVLSARVGDRLVYAPASAGLAYEGWPRANAVIRDGMPVPLPGEDLEGMIVVGCDPALGLAASLLPATGPRRVIALSGSTQSALDAMRSGLAHGALVHARAADLPRRPRGSLRLPLARWRVGIASRGAQPVSVEELADGRRRVVQRDEGASSQKAFVAAVSAAGGSRPPGPTAAGHIEVARSVAGAGGAAAGVTMEPAAIRFGLAFTELELHEAEVWIDARWRRHPAVDALGEIFAAPRLRSRLGLIGGYEPARASGGGRAGSPPPQ